LDTYRTVGHEEAAGHTERCWTHKRLLINGAGKDKIPASKGAVVRKGERESQISEGIS
jgi:hypothetical protein